MQDHDPVSITKDAQMKTPQPLDSRKIHIPINRSDKFESPFVNLEVFHGILPLSRTDSFYGITKEVLFPYYSGYNVIFIGILLPRHRLAGHLLDDAFCFLTAGGFVCGLPLGSGAWGVLFCLHW